jgi:hypothetical protein
MTSGPVIVLDNNKKIGDLYILHSCFLTVIETRADQSDRAV